MGLTQKLGTIPLAIQTDSSNNVGIGGAANASYKLAVTGASLFSSNILANGVMSLGDDGTYGATYKTLGLTGNTDGTHRILAGTSDDMYIAAATSRGIKFCVNGSITTRAIITSNGAVGIGTSSPQSLLDVSGSTPFLRITDTAQTSDNGLIMAIGSLVRGGLTINYSTGEFKSFCGVAGNAYFQTFHTNGSERMRITSTGNFGFGTSSPTEFFHLNNSNSNAVFIRFQATAGGGVYIGNRSDSMELYAGGAKRMEITSGGQIFMYALSASAGTNAARYSTATGQLTYDTSSARYKDNIRDSVYGLNDVLKLRSKMFEYKEDERTDIGLIAEEVFEVIPELVGLDKDGLPNSVSYDRFVSVLVKSIQELSAKVTALENK